MKSNKLKFKLTPSQMATAERLSGEGQNPKYLLRMLLGLALARYDQIEFESAKLKDAGLKGEIIDAYWENETNRFLTTLAAEQFLSKAIEFPQ
ncbi:MAG: hypothetical protein PHG00_13320 [Methylococcales bacterium]|nr:hypothetical protein [Methylococcales bacterium]